MKNLWSPWRSQYIESFHNKEKNSGCIFCELSKKDPEDLSNLLIEKGEHTFTVMNLYPYNNGHLMIVPFGHKSKLEELTTDENREIMEKLQLAAQVLNLAVNAEGLNMGANIGKCAGAGIDDHIHFHLVPRWNGDTNFMPAIGEVKVISQDLVQTKQKLINTYKKLKKEKKNF